jgi:hypothetical protein
LLNFTSEFEPEFNALPNQVQDRMFARIRLLKAFGSELGRPHVDTLNGSRHSNMKELRFNVADAVSACLEKPLTQNGVQYYW